MANIISVLKERFDVDCVDIVEVHGGLSAMNYEVRTANESFFLKVYDMKRVQSHLWTKNIECYMPILVWLNENTALSGRIVRPIKTKSGAFSFDDGDYVYLLFDFVKGETPGRALSRAQVLEAAEIMACLHSCGEIPVNMESIKEDFTVPFCYSLQRFMSESFFASPDDVRAILQPRLPRLAAVNSETMLLSERMKQKDVKTALCHTDAHGYNLIQGESLVLADWEGIKLSPVEADLLMFTKKEYWDVFIERYMRLRMDFELDNDMLRFYILRRKIEDIWAFIEGVLHSNPSDEERMRDLAFLSSCCESLDDMYFEL